MSRNEEGNIMPAKLSELFDGLTLPESVAAGTVLKIVYTEQKNEILINLGLDALSPAAEILAAEGQISSAASGAAARIYPSYPESLYTADYISEVMALLKDRNGAVNGYLDNAEISDDGENCEISLKHGGREMLLQMGINTSIERMIAGFFKKAIHVEFTGVSEVNHGGIHEIRGEAPGQGSSVYARAGSFR